MAKVTVTDTPAVAQAPAKPKFETIQDSRGRTIQLRKLDPLQQARLVMAVGGDIAQNAVYMNGFAMPAASVAFIDDVAFGLPASIKNLESMLSELGEEGMQAISEHFVAKLVAQQATQTAEAAEQAAAKN